MDLVFTGAVIPEPAVGALVAAGLGVLAVARRRSLKKH